MNAKRLTMALLVSLLISGLFTFWLSRRVAKAAHVAAPQKQLVVAAQQTLEAGRAAEAGEPAIGGVAGCAARAASRRSMRSRAESCSFQWPKINLF